MSINIEKSENDTRNYIYKKLSNGLEVVIISDNNETLCGACLNVNIGSANETVPGLAHFLEHMLFMGSRKYPKSNNFMSKINKSGGMTNAYTSDLDTNYYFVCSTETYLSNLDVFGNFLVDPLLSKKYIKKEISNVNSESNKNIVDNDWLTLEITKTLFYKDHSLNHYTAGTIESLTQPNIYEKLKEFKKKFYTAERMSLILFINDKINQIELDNLLVETFTLIPKKDKKEIIRLGPPLMKDKIVKYIPFYDSHQLRLIFQVKTLRNIIETPLPFIYYLLNLKCQGSLFDILTIKKLITKLDCGELNDLDDYTLFSIDCELTDYGFKQYESIYNLIKSYLDFIIIQIKNKNEVLKKHFLESLQISRNNFKFWEKPDINSIMGMISQILKYDFPRNHILNYDLKNDSFDIIVKHIPYIFDDYCCSVCIGSTNFKLKSYQIYPNYNAKYNVDMIEFKSNYEDFNLPILNNFICYNPIIQKIIQSDKPKKLDEEQFISFYYGDIQYKIPQVEIKVFIGLPQLLNSVNIYTNVLLFYSAAYNSIVKIKDLMENAGYNFYFKLNIESIYLNISGYTENIGKAIKIIKYMFSKKFTIDHFTQAKYELEQTFKNFPRETVLSKFATYSQQKIFKTFFMPNEILKELKSITMDKMIKIYNDNIKKGRVSIFCSGNVTQDFSNKLNRKIYKYINIEHSINKLESDNIVKYEDNEMFIYNNKSKDINVLVGLLFSLPEFSLKNNDDWYNYIIFCRLFEVILGNDFYYELRTEKEIGYVVKIKSSIYDNHLSQKIYIKFIVQSSKHKYDYVLREILEFIKRQEIRILNELSELDYKDFILSEKNKLKRDFDTISDLTGYYFNSIVDESYIFNTRDILLDKIDLFTLDIFRNYFEKYIIKNNKLCFVV
jgi:insulysin